MRGCGGSLNVKVEMYPPGRRSGRSGGSLRYAGILEKRHQAVICRENFGSSSLAGKGVSENFPVLMDLEIKLKEMLLVNFNVLKDGSL